LSSALVRFLFFFLEGEGATIFIAVLQGEKGKQYKTEKHERLSLTFNSLPFLLFSILPPFLSLLYLFVIPPIIVENARRESELAKKSIEENKDPQHTTKIQDLESSAASQEDSASLEKSETTAPSQDPSSFFGGSTSASGPNSSVTATASANINNNSNLASPSNATVHAIASAEPVVPVPTAAIVTDEHIAALRIELEEKEASHALLNQQFSNLEKQYKQQEENLKNEIATLREQQKQEDEPRQQAKTKLKELQDSLREAEVNKGKVEKEHRMEVDRRQRIAGQLEAKQKKVENLQQTLKQSEEKLKAEKESHRQQRLELEANLKKRQEEVAAAESSLKALQVSQKTLCSTIEAKEAELSQLQASLQSPKEHLIWEQKSKDLDAKCALLAEEVAQYKQENQQLQERLAEATKNVSKVRTARDHRKTQSELRKANARVSPVESHAAATSSPHPELQHQDHGSSWMNAGWNQSPGTKILNGLFQDEPALHDVSPSPVRKMTGPPPGLTRKDSSPMDTGSSLMDGSLSGYGRDGQESGLQGAIGTSGSPSLLNSQAIVGPPKTQQQRLKSGWRPRSSSSMSSEYLLGDEDSGSLSSLPTATTVSGTGTGAFGEESSDLRQGTRSRTSSISSFNGFQSPLFDPQFVFSTHAYQSHQDPNTSNQLYQQHQQSRQSTLLNGAQKPQTHGMSPRTRFQGLGSSHSPPISHAPSPWGAAGSSTLKNVSGPIAAPVGAGSRSPLVDLETKVSTNAISSPTFNYHNFFGPSSTSTDTLGYEGSSSLNDHQMNEQNVIKSMFESPDTLDLRHHLRTVGSHSALGTQAKILPSHLRSISTPGTSSPLSSPTTAAHQPFQQWDHRVIGRPGSLGRMNSQAEGSSSSLNISDTSSPTSPHGATSFSQSNASSAFGPRKTLPADRGFWGGPGTGSGYGGVSMENSVLPSPTGSSGSSLDMGTPLSVDAHAFADQYFSNRGHRGYETPTSLSSAGFLSSLKHPLSTSTAVDNTGTSKPSSAAPGLGYGQHHLNQVQGQGYGQGFGQGSRTLQQSTSGSPLVSANTATAGGSEADVFGYGLQFNPFGWSMPTGGFDERSTPIVTEEQQRQDKDKLYGGSA
jgi:septal ring factor EnvC (AmiA/AmiB activator)